MGSAVDKFDESPRNFDTFLLLAFIEITALLKVDFGSRSQSRVPDFYSTFVKKSTLKSTLLDFKSGKSDLDSTPPRRSDPYPKPYC